jgi:phosphotransferase system, enzyme I, PtsP
MPQNLPATRILMNRLRTVMAADDQTHARLDQVVKLIASTMVADVCSIYARLAEGALLLIATEGLRRDAIFRTRLEPGEGLVGLVARRAEPVGIQDAPRHPSFSYRPETGEDPFHGFLGVPILRGGRVTGVLTLQNRTERVYGEDEIDTLQTIAMVLAEIVNELGPDMPGAGLVNGAANGAASVRRIRTTTTLKGRIFCEGIGFGRVVLHDPVVAAAQFFANDVEAEEKRLAGALAALRSSIDRMAAIDGAALGDDPRDVMEAYKMLADDPTWAEKLREGVRTGLTAEASVDRTRREHRARLLSARDPYLRERLDDLENLDNRLLRLLAGEQIRPVIAGEHTVLVARRLGPAELLDYANAGLTGILLEEVAASSHAAIVARAMGIPSIGGLENLTALLDEGDAVIVDAERGEVHIGVDAALSRTFRNRAALRSRRQAGYDALRDLPATSRDGQTVKLMINAGLGLDMEMLGRVGADGVGLFRTEFQFLVSDRLPSLADQTQFYRRVLDQAGGRPVVFRTLDLGGDKVLPALSQIREENPALGWRSIRFALDYKGLFRRQLRALVHAAEAGPLRVMFPMVTIPAEYFAAKSMLLQEIERQKTRAGVTPFPIEIGVMLETPALAFALPELAGHTDFISIGTNDLMQFFFAADRMTPSVSDRYDLISPAFLRMVHQVSQSAAAMNIRLSACGEATAAPVAAACFLALGVNSLSMQASAIGAVKHMLRALDLAAFSADLLRAMDKPNAAFRNQVLALAVQHGIELPED